MFRQSGTTGKTKTNTRVKIIKKLLRRIIKSCGGQRVEIVQMTNFYTLGDFEKWN